MKTKQDSLNRPLGSTEQTATLAASRPQFLVPIDFSEPSLKALRHAQHLAAREEAGITLLNVIEEPQSFRTLNFVGRLRQTKNERLARLQTLARQEIGSNIPVKAVVRDGSPAEEITRVASTSRSDMIILGRHERHGLHRWFHGHTATRLVSRAPCPVMFLGD